MNDNGTEKKLSDANITEIRKTVVVSAEDRPRTGSTKLLREYDLTIAVNGEIWEKLTCTATMLRELVVGHLLSEGRISSAKDILDLETDQKNKIACVRVVPDGPKAGAEEVEQIEQISHGPEMNEDMTKVQEITTQNGRKPDQRRVYSLIEQFSSDSLLHKTTSGTHSVILECRGSIVCRTEDINRHNALDKAIGVLMLRDLKPEDCMMFTSGRVALKTIQKITAAKVPVLISKAVPTVQAVQLAQNTGVVLIGRAWPDGYEIYTV